MLTKSSHSDSTRCLWISMNNKYISPISPFSPYYILKCEYNDDYKKDENICQDAIWETDSGST
jgi:hypothetical protein